MATWALCGPGNMQGEPAYTEKSLAVCTFTVRGLWKALYVSEYGDLCTVEFNSFQTTHRFLMFSCNKVRIMLKYCQTRHRNHNMVLQTFKG
jgi:hypothetical protein